MSTTKSGTSKSRPAGARSGPLDGPAREAGRVGEVGDRTPTRDEAEILLAAGKRPSGRALATLRPVSIETGVQRHAEGSCLIRAGHTTVLCAATVDERVPAFRRGSGSGWLTAEYAMLPRATSQRTHRDGRRGGVSGRTQEIQRLIGRSLRAVADLSMLVERQIVIDCDVLEADGGTRTTAITGAFVALALALDGLRPRLKGPVLRDYLAAVSVGIVAERVLVDLDYLEDSSAEVDMNVVMTRGGEFVEVQGTAEGRTFDRGELDGMLDAAARAIRKLVTEQRRALGMRALP